jgi:hypothetical protein
MMLGQPVAMIAQPVSRFSKAQRIGERVGRRGLGADRRLIEDAETRHAAIITARRGACIPSLPPPSAISQFESSWCDRSPFDKLRTNGKTPFALSLSKRKGSN